MRGPGGEGNRAAAASTQHKSVLATPARPSFAKKSTSSPPPNEGRRSADRRTNHWPRQRARPRVQRDALASRRSTAALATPVATSIGSAPGRVS